MKHTIKDRHGHVYTLSKNKDYKKMFERQCVSAEEASKNDLTTEQLSAAWKISRRYHTCVACHKPTEEVGGYKDPAGIKPLFYEHHKC